MKVYVVEYGEYSERGITGVYSTHERAEVAAVATQSDRYVTEYELDEAFDLYDKGLRAFSVEMHYDGSVVKVSNLGYWTGRKADVGMASTNSFLDKRPWRWNCIRVTAWARDDEHAVKIASEYRAQFVAAGWDGVAHFNHTQPHA